MSPPILSRFDLFFVVLDECNEQRDHEIARHLINVHRYRDSPIEAEFSVEQLQRYIRCARTIRPILTPEACELLVERYKQLRAGDVTGSGTAYRITVRQLESMIRLSEALARLHGDKEIKPAYVQEAYRLLKSSIIRVEMDNVDLTISSNSFSSAATALHNEIKGAIHNVNENADNQKFQLKYDEYLRITNMLVYQLRHNEDLSPEDPGMTRSGLIDWFLEQIEHEIQSEAELETRKSQIGAVIDRLAGQDHVLLSIAPSDGSNDPFLVVHPNYSF